jgi:hypothetical protein
MRMKPKLLRRMAAPAVKKETESVPRELITTNNLKTQKPYQPSLVNTENLKTEKGEDKGYLTGIMNLSPSDMSGHGNVCPSASPECRAHCLNTAGTWGESKHVQDARKARTKLYFEDRPKFMEEMHKGVEKLVNQAKKKGLTPSIRVNGTSDLPNVARELAKAYPEVQFYDYTKIPRPWTRTLPNYHITFSRSENNDKEAMEALKHGVDVAVVFNVKKGEPLPSKWRGYPVIDGDKHDLRFLDKEEGGEGPYIVGLRAKGRARGKGSDSGFVVNIDSAPGAQTKAASSKPTPRVEYYEDDGFFEAPNFDDEDE